MNSIKIIALLITFIGVFTCYIRGMDSFNDGPKTHKRLYVGAPAERKEESNLAKLAVNKLRSKKGLTRPEDILLNYSMMLQELKDKPTAKDRALAPEPIKITGLTQTEAHLKIYKNDVAKYLNQHPWLGSAVDKIIQQERFHDQTHYVFYHSQVTALSVMQDFLNEVYQLLHMEKVNDFIFLRNPDNLSGKESAQEFLDKNTAVHDHDMNLRRRLLSVNLAFFGNITRYGWAGECTFDFFISHRNINVPGNKDLLLPLFTRLNMDTEGLDRLVKLSDNLQSKHGVLLQIFVPKDKVDECAYLSMPYGRPLDMPILPEYFDAIKKRHTRVAPILDYYKAHPEKIAALDRLQARIVLDRDIMLNPKGGVKIIRHGALSHAINKEYKEKVKQIAIDSVKKLLKSGVELAPVNPDMGKTSLQRLQELRAKL